MRVRLLAFASAADALGAAEQAMEVPDGCTVGGLKDALADLHPELEALLPRLAVAVDGEIVGDGARLDEGVEVALLPPVSGGNDAATAEGDGGDRDDATDDGFLTEAPLDAARVAASVAGPDCGAVVLFVGTVRDQHQGRPVARLTYDAYRPMAAQRLGHLVADLGARHGVRVRVVHRLGTLEPGEASVVIAVAAAHREAAYAASRECLERLKREVPVWKREHYADGSARWREEEPLLRL
jgi:molybdopterin synthase catalytic subunit/molybdopterin converting factor small subunit